MTRTYIANNPKGGPAQVRIFNEELILAPPEVESNSASSVTGDSAKLRARINPNNLETTYRFEYGLEDCAVAVTPCTQVPIGGASIGKGRKGVIADQALVGLQPRNVYHYRVVAANSEDTTESPDRTFTTQGSALGFQLADSRVWEMVSPPDKHGGSLSLNSAGLIQAAEDGDGLAYLTLGSIAADPQGNRAVESASVLARRGPAGWQSTDITPPHASLTRPRDAEYRLMSPDLSRALLEVYDDAPLSPLTTESTPYLRQNTEPPLYTPLLTGAAGHANVAPGTVFGSGNGVEVEGASADLSTLVVNSPTPLLEGESFGGTYIWNDGHLQPAGGGQLGSGVGSIRNAISADGSRVFTSGTNYGADVIGIGGALTLRDIAQGESARLDLPQAGAKGGSGSRPIFQVASTDGRIAFFTDSQHLTKGASPEGQDLYRCEIPAGAIAGGCASLTDLSAPRKGSGESSQVKDLVPAASDDGARIYFVAEGVLDVDPNASGDLAVAGQPNLYIWEEGSGVRFIATLSEADRPDWGAAPNLVNGYSNRIAADASPSGRYLTFMSNRSLTGRDNQTEDGEAAQQAFRYDALSGELVCVSCNPTGSIPRAKVLTEAAARSTPVRSGPLNRWRHLCQSRASHSPVRWGSATIARGRSSTTAASSSTPMTPSSPPTPTVAGMSTNTSRSGWVPAPLPALTPPPCAPRGAASASSPRAPPKKKLPSSIRASTEMTPSFSPPPSSLHWTKTLSTTSTMPASAESPPNCPLSPNVRAKPASPRSRPPMTRPPLRPHSTVPATSSSPPPSDARRANKSAMENA